MNRRDFLKIVGITTATSTAALYGCGSKEGSSEGSKVLGPIPTDKMTYRSFPGLGSDKVSILGYGCMRWPTVSSGSARDSGDEIDQEMVNALVDLLRNDMGRLAPPGGVRVEKLFAIEDYTSLHQMTSTVIAEPVSASLGEILAALFPCGSITGAPKIRAMELIRELEPEPRKLY